MFKDQLPGIEIHETRRAMGASAARHFVSKLETALKTKARARIILGCAPSQDEFFAGLVQEAQAHPALWARVEVFHMDDYVGLPESHPESFRTYLRKHLLDHVKVAAFNLIRGEAASPYDEARRYSALLAAAPIDVIGMGIGENGHIAFNDPPVADFADPALVKVVEMDGACRQQQVNDGCFPDLAAVPKLALTITLPVFSQATSLCCVVPGPRKAQAVRNSLLDPIGTNCPGTLLRTHADARLFLDRDSSARYLDSKTKA
ncbi:glucosamine-6-phosphate isomerase [Nibricoccus aquaticus]|uniref:Glucosamine-6-phosphate isomerase n=1 Tax=Nibricoccus aquaticus TaxID=2576891 RepID=A0A290QLY3_9BACT|nr:glucosamine-6-phosphate deaminase [Nibricoccus aquaticus]ATC65541.1 glucosamine-6-phosphate isomerase [Nibricoccus aquaticus]